MATVTSIATALKTTLLNGLSDVDYASIDEFLPPIKTRKVALIIVPNGQETSIRFESLAATTLHFTHRIPCEFWVKHTQGDAATTQQRARDIARLAAVELAQNDGSSYDLDFDLAVESQIADQYIEVGGVPFLVVTLLVPVTNSEAV